MEKNPLILIVDDDKQTRLLVRRSLEKSGFSVEEAEDGVQALAAYERLKHDLVLLDVMMTGMDGFEACRRFRKIPGGEEVPILMMTGLDDVASINCAFEVGATDFITKPISWPLLSHRVRYILRNSWAADKLRHSEARNRALIDAIPDLMFRVRDDGTILNYVVSKKDDRSIQPDDFIDKKLYDLFPDLARKTMPHVELALKIRETQIIEYSIPEGDSTRSYEARIVVSGNHEALAIVRDITERKQTEEHIRFLAYYDSLTNLPNRFFFKEILSRSIARAKRFNQTVGILFLDLDGFKRINDTLGHSVGDELLKSVAERLTVNLRCTDTVAQPTDTDAYQNVSADENAVSRLGGDEFIVLVTDISRNQDATMMATRILHVLAQPYFVKGHEVFISASIGISLYPSDGETVESLLKNADTAMYCAKDHGKNNYKFYTNSMNAAAVERLTLENNLRKALDRDEFLLNYQPQIHIKSGCVSGMEALIRWYHPKLGLISPAQFIPLAEETGLIIPIGEWVLRTVCNQIKEWKELGLTPVPVSVNISSNQFRKEGLPEIIASILKETNVDPGLLKLEITESLIMQNVDETILILHELKSMGLGLMIDDFGTGYSSLSYLKRFPIDDVKIDISFIKDLCNDPNDAAITKAIIAMSHNMNLSCVAEGVEMHEQLAFLHENGCDGFQGYLHSKPIPAEEIKKLLKK